MRACLGNLRGLISSDPSLPVWQFLRIDRRQHPGLGESEASDAHPNRRRPAAIWRDAFLTSCQHTTNKKPDSDRLIR